MSKNAKVGVAIVLLIAAGFLFLKQVLPLLGPGDAAKPSKEGWIPEKPSDIMYFGPGGPIPPEAFEQPTPTEQGE